MHSLIKLFMVSCFVFQICIIANPSLFMQNIPAISLAKCPEGDISNDCDVDMEDLVLFAEEWLAAAGSPGDLVGNDGVNAEDWALLSQNWLVAKPRVIINEIHYNPDLAQELVGFVELYNASSTDADMSGWQFTKGITYTFPAGTILAAGKYLVIAEDPTPAVVDVTVAGKYGISSSLVIGPFTGNLSNDGEEIELSDSSGQVVDRVDYKLGFPWPMVGDGVSGNGTGYSIQLANPLRDNDLGGNWRSAYPTPGGKNSAVYSENLGPCLRQVNHSPMQPKAGQVVTITAKATDSDGVASVTLRYQIVEPGSYIAVTDAAYSTTWTNLTMHDDGLDGDVLTGDDIFTVQLTAGIQTHRRLIRYQIQATDTGNHSVTVPYADDLQKNFAYFVYNGIPAWTGANRPGTTTAVTYGTEVMNSLPVYHLISKKTDVENSTWYSKYTGEDYLWYGTLVYDGVVYDHIQYRARGGCWRYAMGKNMWKFKFNRGHDFQARDDYGEPYDTAWDNLNLGACIQQGDYWHRGEQGMFEAVGFKMFNLTGIEASRTNWVQFRVIDEAEEAGADQYTGDLWGLYLAVEQPDGRFLKEHGLADGNFYKIEDFNGTLNNQGPTQSTNGADYVLFKSAWVSSTKPAEAWWKQNVSLSKYYNYRCVVEGIHHGDIGYGKNYNFYHDPVTNLWTMYPWDLDLTWANTMYGNGQEPFISSSYGAIFNNAVLTIEYQNRLREFYDLFYNTNQLYQLIEEYAAVIDNPDGSPSFVDVDRAMWDYNPVMIDSSRVNTSKAGQGRFYAGNSSSITIPSPGGFRGMVQLMKNYVTSTTKAFNTYTEDAAVPVTPTIVYNGTTGYPSNDLTFTTSAFSDSGGVSTFAALKWRIGEVAPFTVTGLSASSQELIASGAEWKYLKGTAEPSASWNGVNFNDSGWTSAVMPFGYGVSSPVLSTTLTDMYNSYTTVYLRKTFTINDPSAVTSLVLTGSYDDGFNVWINGVYVEGVNSPGQSAACNTTAPKNNSPGYATMSLTWTNASSYLTAGTNVIAIQLLNNNIKSGDLLWAPMLTANFNTSGSIRKITPGKYEIVSAWESGDIVDSTSLSVQVPASKVKPGHAYRIRSRMKDTSGRWSHWSAPIEFTVGQPLGAGFIDTLRITELMYNPAPADTANGELNLDASEFEYIELKNSGETALDLSNVSFSSGITFSFAGSAVTSLEAGQFVLVVRNTNAFLSRYPGLSARIAGQYTGKFDNTGESVVLTDYYNGTVADFEYNDGFGWPISADGAGHSLVPLASAIAGQPYGSLRWGGNWRASAFIYGSPGADDPEPDAGLVINEVMAHTDISDSAYPDYDSNDWVELYNPTSGSLTLGSDWYLSDDADNLKKWAIPVSTIASHGWVSFDEIAGFHNPITSGFGLNKAGEQVYLSYLPGTAMDRVVDCVKFGGQENTVSYGRYPDGGTFWFDLAAPGTRDAANANPIQHSVVISELMYHPLDNSTKDEYVELTNPTAAAVNLYNTVGSWRLSSGISYTFPTGKSIPAGGKIVVVPFDPAVETTRLAKFNSDYGCSLTANVTVFGPGVGALSNSGERIALESPQEADPPQVTTTWWVVIDQVIYGDYAPWPQGLDEAGEALKRVSTLPAVSSDDPTNWISAVPTPGY